MGEVAISRTLERVLCSASNAHKNFRNTSLNLKVKLDNRSIRNITIISAKIKSQSKAEASTDDFLFLLLHYLPAPPPHPGPVRTLFHPVVA